MFHETPKHEIITETSPDKRNGLMLDDFRNSPMSSPKMRNTPKLVHLMTHTIMTNSFEKVVTEDNLHSQNRRLSQPEKVQFIAQKHYYQEILKELESIPFFMQSDEQIDQAVAHADREDQYTFKILDARFGRSYAQKLYHIYFRFSNDENGKTRMTLTKLYNFMKEYSLFNETLNKEMVSVVFAKRCHGRLADFAAFIDILYKFNKLEAGGSGPQKEKAKRFQAYLDSKIIQKHNNVMDVLKAQSRRPSVTVEEFALENDPFRILQENDGIIKHLFALFESYDVKYSDRAVIKVADYKRFLTDLYISPVFCSLSEAIDIFRRFQFSPEGLLDFKGFVKCLGFIANIAFEKPNLAEKYNTYGKRLAKFFDMLAETNEKLSEELIFRHLTKVKH